MSVKKEEVNPFGKIHDYISVSLDDNGYRVSDGTTSLVIDEIRVSASSNWSKPFELRANKVRMLLTFKQVEKLFLEYLRYNKRDE